METTSETRNVTSSRFFNRLAFSVGTIGISIDHEDKDISISSNECWFFVLSNWLTNTHRKRFCIKNNKKKRLSQRYNLAKLCNWSSIVDGWASLLEKNRSSTKGKREKERLTRTSCDKTVLVVWQWRSPPDRFCLFEADRRAIVSTNARTSPEWTFSSHRAIPRCPHGSTRELDGWRSPEVNRSGVQERISRTNQSPRDESHSSSRSESRRWRISRALRLLYSLSLDSRWVSARSEWTSSYSHWHLDVPNDNWEWCGRWSSWSRSIWGSPTDIVEVIYRREFLTENNREGELPRWQSIEIIDEIGILLECFGRVKNGECFRR